MGEVGLSPNNKMATTAKARPYKQDLPPKGGYAPITFKRIPAQQIMKDRWWLGAFIVYQTGALIYMKHALNQEKKLRVEERSFEKTKRSGRRFVLRCSRLGSWYILWHTCLQN